MPHNVKWDPSQYLTFDKQRLQPALDLIARIPEEAQRITDIGCGPGNVTNILYGRWPTAQICGIDNSPDMLTKAKNDLPHIEWQHADLNTWQSSLQVDVLFSNAALHWLDDHELLFPNLIKSVKPGGTLAIQMPRNWAAPSHMSINQAVSEGSWKSKLEPLIKEQPTRSPEFYYEILSPHVQELEIWETEYIQVLEGENPVAEFVKGSWLRRFLQALDEPERTEFENCYREKVKLAYPKQTDGKTLFPFRRLFILTKL